MKANLNILNTSRTLVAVALGVLLIASGSARADGVVLLRPLDDQQEITAELGASVVGYALPNKPIGDASTYFLLQEKAAIYQVTAGPNSGKTQTLGLSLVRRLGGKMAWRFQFSPTLAGVIRQTSAGDLLMPAVTDTGEVR
jgi:hypothetical protein